MEYLPFVIAGILIGAALAALPFWLALTVGQLLLTYLPLGKPGRFLLIMFKNLQRNPLRTFLTCGATFILVMVVVLVWSTLHYLDALTQEKNKDLKIIVSEKWQRDSRLPFSYARPLSEGAADDSKPNQVRPQDSMTWQFYVGTIDAEKKTREGLVFVIAMEPRKMLSVMESFMDDIDNRSQNQPGRKHMSEDPDALKAVEFMEQNKKAVMLGYDRAEALHKQVGERFKLTGINYPGLDLEFEVAGILPRGRFDGAAVMNRDYLNDAMDAYPKTHGGQKLPGADKSLSLVWLQVKDKEEYSKIVSQIELSGRFENPSIKCETLSAGIATAMEGFQDFIWGLRWLLSPAVLFTMTLVIANAISISIRERRSEIALLKVLGYRPGQILFIVLGEALLIGGISGLLSGFLTWVVVDHVIPYNPQMQLYIPLEALYWGPGVGGMAAFLGCVFPSWAACRIRVNEVFARTA